MLKRLIVWGAAAALFWLAWRQISWKNVLLVVAAVDGWSLPSWALLNAAVITTSAGRWYSLIRPFSKKVPFPTVVLYRLAAQGVSYFTPGPQFGGEPLQVWLLTRRHHLGSDKALATVTADKLLELIVNFGILLAGAVVLLQTTLFPAASSRWAVAVAAILWLIPALLLIRLIAGHTPLSDGWTYLQRLLPDSWQQRTTSWASLLRESENQVAHLWQTAPAALVYALLATLINWGFWLLEFWFVYHLLGVDLTPLQLIILVTAARLAFLTPLPAGLGAFEAGQLVAVLALGLLAPLALSATLLMRGRDVVINGLGLWLSGRLANQTPKFPFPNNF